MKWIKKGRIWTPGDKWWAKHYALMPTPVFLSRQNCIRVYFCTTDKNLFGRVAFVDLSADEPSQVVRESDGFVLDVGEDGTFDDCGVAPSCFLRDGRRDILYTVGFQRCVKIPLLLSAGIAHKQGDKFFRLSRAPILPRTDARPFMQGAPFVLKEGGIYHMWHWTVSGWKDSGTKRYSYYKIGYATSEDGLHWQMTDDVCLSPRVGEIGVARPWVIKHGSQYLMWFSVRNLTDDGIPAYRQICYAVSDDGIKWRRHKSPCLTPSRRGWDSQMVCYAAVIRVKDRWLMFYNGNGNGKIGFGWAELDGDLV